MALERSLDVVQGFCEVQKLQERLFKLYSVKYQLAGDPTAILGGGSLPSRTLRCPQPAWMAAGRSTAEPGRAGLPPCSPVPVPAPRLLGLPRAAPGARCGSGAARSSRAARGAPPRPPRPAPLRRPFPWRRARPMGGAAPPVPPPAAAGPACPGRVSGRSAPSLSASRRCRAAR